MTSDKRKRVALLKLEVISLSLFLAARVLAGDAVAVGYNQDGVWTSVTYYASSRPKGGRDYKTETEAREAAIRDLQKRDVIKGARVEIISSSDATGFVAVGRGTDNSRKDVNVAGRGKTQKEADDNAFEQLKETGATKGQRIIYRYHSYGVDAK